MCNEEIIIEEMFKMIRQKIILKKIFLVMLVLIITLSNTFVVSADVGRSNTVSPYFVNISNYSTNLNISGIKAECSATVKAVKTVNLKIKMELQKEKSSGYETVETWSSSKTGTYLAMSESRLINVLYDYRLKVTFTAGSETEIVYKY